MKAKAKNKDQPTNHIWTRPPPPPPFLNGLMGLMGGVDFSKFAKKKRREVPIFSVKREGLVNYWGCFKKGGIIYFHTN